MSSNPLFKFGFALLAAALFAAASSAFGQSTLDHLVVNAPYAAVSVHITQDGAGKLGTATDPITLVGDSTGRISLTVEQIGASGTQASLIKAYTTGTAANTITLKQETADTTPGAVNDVWAKILLGTQGAPAEHQDVTLLQQASHAQALIESTGNNLTAYITQLPGAGGSSTSTVDIKSNGDNNTFNVTTQQAGDWLKLAVNGSGNSFTFAYDAYKGIDWGVASSSTSSTPVTVNTGTFVAQCGGSNCWVTDTSSNNVTAAANATVTKR